MIFVLRCNIPLCEMLTNKLRLATKELGIREVAIAGGVSANSGLRNALLAEQEKGNWKWYNIRLLKTLHRQRQRSPLAAD